MPLKLSSITSATYSFQESTVITKQKYVIIFVILLPSNIWNSDCFYLWFLDSKNI